MNYQHQNDIDTGIYNVKAKLGIIGSVQGRQNVQKSKKKIIYMHKNKQINKNPAKDNFQGILKVEVIPYSKRKLEDYSIQQRKRQKEGNINSRTTKRQIQSRQPITISDKTQKKFNIKLQKKYPERLTNEYYILPSAQSQIDKQIQYNFTRDNYNQIRVQTMKLKLIKKKQFFDNRVVDTRQLIQGANMKSNVEQKNYIRKNNIYQINQKQYSQSKTDPNTTRQIKKYNRGRLQHELININNQLKEKNIMDDKARTKNNQKIQQLEISKAQIDESSSAMYNLKQKKMKIGKKKRQSDVMKEFIIKTLSKAQAEGTCLIVHKGTAHSSYSPPKISNIALKYRQSSQESKNKNIQNNKLILKNTIIDRFNKKFKRLKPEKRDIVRLSSIHNKKLVQMQKAYEKTKHTKEEIKEQIIIEQTQIQNQIKQSPQLKEKGLEVIKEEIYIEETPVLQKNRKV